MKLNTLYDLKASIPSYIHISNAQLHDVNILDRISYEPGSFYVMDKAYIDFGRLYGLHKIGAYFITRAKTNMKFGRMYSRKVKKENGVKYDQIGKLTGTNTKNKFPEKLRRIKYYDKENNRHFIFITNNHKISAVEVAALYKKRWEIELFFKWVKQHLRIKTFWGHSENAVKVQIYSAIIAYCLVSICSSKLKSERNIYEIIQILSISLFDKTPVKEIVTNENYTNNTASDPNQLTFSYF